VVAEKNSGVGPVARVTESADPEHSVVDQVADEHRVPLRCGIRPEGVEEALEVAVDVADDQSPQIFRSQSDDANLAFGL